MGVNIDWLILTCYNVYMNNISKEANLILDIIKRYGPIRSSEIVKMADLSIKNTYKHLRSLLSENLIKKTGSTPLVYYSVVVEKEDDLIVKDVDDLLIEQNYIYVSPSGDVVRGINGFAMWCEKNNFKYGEEKKLYLDRFKYFQNFKKDGVISSKNKNLSVRAHLHLNDIFFGDFYTFDHFGKTKLGQLVYLGKSSQNKEIIREVAKLVRPALNDLLKKKDIKHICYIPPTIDRKIQFMDVLKKELNLDLSEIIAKKIASDTKVPQKTLRKLEDRVINAKTTIAVNPNQKIEGNILIIDDATGSGATINETAKKIRVFAGDKVKIYGYSIVGSFKGFDVISEV